MYVKLIDGVPVEPPVTKGSILNYNTNIDLLIQDGYKLLIEAEIPQTNRMYHFEYTENSNNITESVVFDETQEEADEREKEVREEQFGKDFFQTSLGYIRRSVSMQDGSQKDFLSDLLPSIALAVNSGLTVNVLAYNNPDFSEPVTDWTIYQHMEVATAQFIQECFATLQNDFLPIN